MLFKRFKIEDEEKTWLLQIFRGRLDHDLSDVEHDLELEEREEKHDHYNVVRKREKLVSLKVVVLSGLERDQILTKIFKIRSVWWWKRLGLLLKTFLNDSFQCSELLLIPPPIYITFNSTFLIIISLAGDCGWSWIDEEGFLNNYTDRKAHHGLFHLYRVRLDKIYGIFLLLRRNQSAEKRNSFYLDELNPCERNVENYKLLYAYRVRWIIFIGNWNLIQGRRAEPCNRYTTFD